MESRDEAIQCALAILQEDIVDQFHINEVDAALAGKTVFSIENSIGEQMTLRNIYQNNSESLRYELISFSILLIREASKKNK